MCDLNATEVVWAKIKCLARDNSAVGDTSYEALKLRTEHAMYMIFSVTKEDWEGCGAMSRKYRIGFGKLTRLLLTHLLFYSFFR
jgi:hypothetical protein